MLSFDLDIYLHYHLAINSLQICWKWHIFFCSIVYAVLGGFFFHLAQQLMTWGGVSSPNSLQDEVLHCAIRNYQEIFMLNQVLTKVRGAIKKAKLDLFHFHLFKPFGQESAWCKNCMWGLFLMFILMMNIDTLYSCTWFVNYALMS